MNKIKLISDSTCDLTEELLKEHDIEVIPLYVNFNDRSYFDGVDLSVPEMYEIVKKNGVLPKTAAASPGAFFKAFEKYTKAGYDVIYIGIGSKLSATLSSANTAKSMLESKNIHLIDSQNLSSGSGLLLLKASDFIKQGLSATEIKTKIEKLVPKVRSQFVIDTLEYLYKGGRLNALSAMMGTMLKIKPIIKVRNGAMSVGKKARGNILKGVDMMIKEVIEHKDEIDDEYMMITHSMAHETYLYIIDKIKDKIKIKNLYETNAGCVISSHCGKGTIGILYILK